MNFTAKTFNELTTIELYEILKSRSEIFIMEQNIHCLDMDDVDYKSIHCFLEDNNRVVAYLRAFYKNDDEDTVKIGRVLTLRHGNGWGRELMEKSLIEIKEKLKCKKVQLDAQKQAAGFYEKLGFKITSGEFLEEGIVHVSMEMEI